MSIPCACALIVLPSGEILGTSRKYDHNDMGLPGGKLEPNETYEQALHREVLEETGYTIDILDVPYYEGEYKGLYVRTYACVLTTDTPAPVAPGEGIVRPITDKHLTESSSFAEYFKEMLKHFNYKYEE